MKERKAQHFSRGLEKLLISGSNLYTSPYSLNVLILFHAHFPNVLLQNDECWKQEALILFYFIILNRYLVFFIVHDDVLSCTSMTENKVFYFYIFFPPIGWNGITPSLRLSFRFHSTPPPPHPVSQLNEIMITPLSSHLVFPFSVWRCLSLHYHVYMLTVSQLCMFMTVEL